MQPEVSIIIINYNTFDLTTKCIQSVYDKTSGINIEIILVDNASVECDAILFKQNYPNIILVKNTTNLGFAGGNNAGIKYASGEYILLLNSDTELIENSIQIIYEKCAPLNKLGAATIKLIYPGGEIQPAANYFPDNIFLFLEVTRLFRIFKKYYFSKRPSLDYTKSFIADWIWGTFYFFPKKNLELFGGKLPDTFFMYGEDVEWGYLLAKHNLKTYYFADSTIIHHSGKSFYKDRNSTLTKNARAFVTKYYGHINCWVFICLTATGNFIEKMKQKFLR